MRDDHGDASTLVRDSGESTESLGQMISEVPSSPVILRFPPSLIPRAKPLPLQQLCLLPPIMCRAGGQVQTCHPFCPKQESDLKKKERKNWRLPDGACDLHGGTGRKLRSPKMGREDGTLPCFALPLPSLDTNMSSSGSPGGCAPAHLNSTATGGVGIM